MIREYILHDRGNSIFLGDSFANLPSPVGEGQTIKNLFRFNEDDDEKKLEKERDRDKNEIKIEGKPEKTKVSKDGKPGDKNELNMRDIEEIDKIVFEVTNSKPKVKQPQPPVQRDKPFVAEHTQPNDPYQDLQATKLNKAGNRSLSESLNLANQSGAFIEEDSYINPSNVSKVNNSGINDDPKHILASSVNPYTDKNKPVHIAHQYDNINSSNMLVDGDQSMASGSQIIDQSLYEEQNRIEQKLSDTQIKIISMVNSPHSHSTK